MAKLQVTHPHAVSNNILALRIETGEITRGTQKAYVKQAGDTIKTKAAKNKFKTDREIVYRDGKAIGILVDDGRIIRTMDTLRGPELNETWAKQTSNYSVNGITPTNVYIKSKPSESARVGVTEDSRVEFSKYDFAMEHTVYLELPDAMTIGESYQLDFKGDELEDITFDYKPESVRSEAVHISYNGFQPTDPAKVAFLSTWMGPDGKGVSYKEGQKFWLTDDKGNKVFEGEIELSRGKNEAEDFISGGKNYNGTDVYLADFSEFTKKGTYKVVVDEVGTSYDFEIGDNNWERAFQVHMEGLYTQRSGIKKTRDFSDYTAPRSFHPDDGVKVYQSNAQVINTRTGLAQGVDMFPQLNGQLTDEIVENAYGGWMDAGDWDRSTQHLDVSRKLLEVAGMFPEYFVGVNLTIPESGNQIADVVDEALWGVDFFKRLQTEEGGVRGGIESASHPQDMEASWQESLKVIAYAPDIWTSYQYAGVAARAAHVIKDIDPTRAQGYIESALKAIAWAEKENNANPNQYKNLSKFWQIADERNLAAAELYRATGDEQWHDMFLESTVFTKAGEKAFRSSASAKYDHRDAAFVYATTEQPVDKAVQDNAKAAVLRVGDDELAAINKAGFKWNKNQSVSIGWGAHDGFAQRTEVLRSHFLSGNEKYLKGALLASQFIAGANPDNVSYTTGIGPRQPDSTHHVDSYVRGQDAPKGISVYGPADLDRLDKSAQFALEEFRKKSSTQPEDWPTTEGFFDVFKYIPGSEFTITETVGPNAYATGYFAAHSAKATGNSPVTPPPTPPITPPPTTTPPTTTPPVVPPVTDPQPPTEPAPAFSRRRYEAEDLALKGFEKEKIRGAAASAGAMITLEGTEARWGRAKGIFDGADGNYKVTVGYYDENDGRATAQVKIGREKTTFRWDQDLGSDTAAPSSRVRKVIHDSIALKTGDTFELVATQNREEHGRFDFIKFAPVKSAPVKSDRSAALTRNKATKAAAAEREIAAQALTAPKATTVAAEGSMSETYPAADQTASAPALSKLVSATANNLLLDLSTIDLNQDGEVDAQVTATFEADSMAGYNNTVGFYAVEDAQGTLVDTLTGKTLSPGDADYSRVALTQRLSKLDMTRDTGTLTSQLDGGQLLAPFLVANATAEQAIQSPANLKRTYFAFAEANADGFQHVQGSSDRTLSFEDLWGGGDQNFTDFMVSTELSIA
ncbi:MAG: glycoside hydrolase family 9 protein [Cyanobacteria bacterium J06634_5]